MTKTRRQIQADLKLVDLVAEIIDARIPISSRNPDIDELVGEKPRLIVLNRADQADPAMNRVWTDWFRRQGWAVLETNARDGKGVGQFSTVIRQALKEKLEQWKAKGLVGRPVRAMVVGVPNVGKSTFINQVAKRKSAKAGNRPGVTRGKQWVSVGIKSCKKTGGRCLCFLWKHRCGTGRRPGDRRQDQRDPETTSCSADPYGKGRFPSDRLWCQCRCETRSSGTVCADGFHLYGKCSGY